jgi:hypothetical protein
MKDFIKNISLGANIADELTESSEERQAVLSARHAADMNSDSALSKAIRPLSTLWTGLIWGVVTLIAIIRGSVEWEVYGIASGPFITCISWYFESRKREKIAAENARANVEIEKLKVRHDVRQDRKEARHERKLERRHERGQDKND